MLRTTAPSRPKSLDELLDARLVAQLSQLDVASRKVFSGKLQGERRSKRKGQSVEFADHRQYAAGDDLRRLDWNIYARLDRLFTKLFLEEEDLSLHLVLDASASMDCGEPSKYLYAQRLAAALGYIGLANLNRVAISAMAGETATAKDDSGASPEDAPGAALRVLRDLRGKRRIHDLGQFLVNLEPAGGANFPDAARRIALSRRGRGVMVVLADFFFKEGYEEGLRLLKGRGYDLFVIQILSPQEVSPELGGDLRLRDTEDRDLTEVTISAPLLKKYKQNLGAYIEQLRMFCARREITFLSVTTDTPVESLLVDYLRTRGLLS
ncbi:MAG: DUF58 domain-containing protein [Phycisphaeraceae bacterium]|nr:DUF58 domain-containing protein [Phycisphaeraceae bacterium]